MMLRLHVVCCSSLVLLAHHHSSPTRLPDPQQRRTFLHNTQAAINKGKLRLQDLLTVKGPAESGMLDAFQNLLGHPQTSEGMAAAVDGMRAQLQAAHQQARQEERAAGEAMARARSKQHGGAWVEALLQTVAAGSFVKRGPE